MGRWVVLLGGLIVWAIHFMGVYALASLADVFGAADDAAWRMAIVAFSAACLAGAGFLLARAVRDVRTTDRRRSAHARFHADLSAVGAGLSLVAIAWQALPAVVGY